MKFRSLARAALAGTAALAFSAMSAGAQSTFNYFTTGQFTGGGAGSNCDYTAAATTQTCGNVNGSLGLTFTGTPTAPGGYASGSTIQLGTFQPLGSGTITVPPPNVMFRLFINQTDPTTGQASVVGSFTGTFTQGVQGTANFSNLFWTPSQQSVVIGPTTYTLIFDQAANNPQSNACPQVSNTGICVAAVNPTTITAKGFVTSTVPEPSSMALLGTGLIGLVPMIRRKK